MTEKSLSKVALGAQKELTSAMTELKKLITSANDSIASEVDEMRSYTLMSIAEATAEAANEASRIEERLKTVVSGATDIKTDMEIYRVMEDMIEQVEAMNQETVVGKLTSELDNVKVNIHTSKIISLSVNDVRSFE